MSQLGRNPLHSLAAGDDATVEPIVTPALAGDIAAVKAASPISRALGGHDAVEGNAVVGWLARGLMGGATLLARALFQGAKLHPEMRDPLNEALHTLFHQINQVKP